MRVDFLAALVFIVYCIPVIYMRSGSHMRIKPSVALIKMQVMKSRENIALVIFDLGLRMDGIADGKIIMLNLTLLYIYIYIYNFHTKMNNLTQGSLGQAASSEDFSASEFYYTVHVHT